jgi:hypothetical protein
MAGILAFFAAVPTESPAFPTAEPIESPTSVSVPVTPLADCREADEPDLAPRDLFWRDLDELGERLAVVLLRALGDLEAFRADVARGLLRGGELPLLRVVPVARPLERVFVWAMSTHLPRLHRSACPSSGVPIRLPLHAALKHSRRAIAHAGLRARAG